MNAVIPQFSDQLQIRRTSVLVRSVQVSHLLALTLVTVRDLYGINMHNSGSSIW